MKIRVFIAALLAVPIAYTLTRFYSATPHHDRETVDTLAGEPVRHNALAQVDNATAKKNEAMAAVGKKLKDVKRRVLVYLKSRDHIIAVHAAGGSPESQRVTVATKDGTVLAEEISRQEFERLYPELHEFYRTSYAEAWAGTDIATQALQ